MCVCVNIPKRFPLASPFVAPEAQAHDSLLAGSKQLPLSDVIEEVIDHFPQGGNVQHVSSPTLIVSQYQSHFFNGAICRVTCRERDIERKTAKKKCIH